MADFNNSLEYAPGIVPREPDQIQQFLEIELSKIKAAIDIVAAGHVDRTHVAPTKPRDGDFRYADGTNWNPGSGKGVYFYRESTSSWVLWLAL